jgi:hypothetical protein
VRECCSNGSHGCLLCSKSSTNNRMFIDSSVTFEWRTNHYPDSTHKILKLISLFRLSNKSVKKNL